MCQPGLNGRNLHQPTVVAGSLLASKVGSFLASAEDLRHRQAVARHVDRLDIRAARMIAQKGLCFAINLSTDVYVLQVKIGDSEDLWASWCHLVEGPVLELGRAPERSPAIERQPADQRSQRPLVPVKRPFLPVLLLCFLPAL